ncbi:MAG: hypothetical protein V2A76_14810 [Planctomycetota bacterium]
MLRRTFFPLALALPLLLSGASPAQTLVVPLEFQRQPDRMDASEYWPNGSAYTGLGAEPLEGEFTLPAFTGRRPLFGSVRLGETEFKVAVDVQAENDRFPNRIFFDRNHNRDLTDDPVLDGKATFSRDDDYCTVSFATHPDILFERNGCVFPYTLEFLLSGSSLKDPDLAQAEDRLSRQVSFRVRSRCAYAGFFDLAGETYSVVLGDRNCDGSFADSASVNSYALLSSGRREFYARGDSFCLMQGDRPSRDDEFLLGDHLLIGESLFEVAIDTFADTLTLTPVIAGRLPLKLAQAPERMLLQNEKSEHCVMMFRPGTVARIPAGSFRLLNYQLLRTGADGDLWLLGANGTSVSPRVTLAEGQAEETLQFGEPFTYYATVADNSIKRYRENRERGVRIGFEIEGQGRESVSALALLSGTPRAVELSQENTTRPLEPKYTIVKATGEKAKSGSFEYG